MKQISIKLGFKARWELYLLGIKIGHPFKSRFRLAIEGLKELFFPKERKAWFG